MFHVLILLFTFTKYVIPVNHTAIPTETFHPIWQIC
jgi:hypothetical protein